MMNSVNNFFRHFADRMFARPRLVLATLLAATVAFGVIVPQVKLWSNFADLLPQNHPYIKLHNEIRDKFGGANVIVVSVAVKDGTIFTNEAMQAIHNLTQGVDNLPSVNHDLVVSVTHRTQRKISLTAEGAIVARPYYNPDKKIMTSEDLLQMQTDIMSNLGVYGVLVSPDLKAALIKATLNEGQLDYKRTFDELQELRTKNTSSNLTIYAAGYPVLIGWVYSYLPQIFEIFAGTLVIMIALLIIYFRKLYGIAVPLAAIAVSTIWGIGIVVLLDYNLDPLTLVIPFLVSARSLSHAIQFTERYYQELALTGGNGRQSARNTLDSMFKPGSLGIVVDALGLLLIALASIPIHVKLAVYCFLWAMQSVITVVIFVPILLAVLPAPRNPEIRHSGIANFLPWVARWAAKGRGPAVTLIVTLVLTLGSIVFAIRTQIGEAESGSPLLFPNSDFNISARAINDTFPGSEELFIVARTEKPQGLKEPAIEHALQDFQNFMLQDPDLGGVKGVPNLIKLVNRMLSNDDPKLAQIPRDAISIGGLLFTYMTTSPIPGALKEFINPEASEANMVFYYKDHKGTTIRRAIDMVKTWMASPAAQVEGLSIHLAGGIIGVTAATDEAVYHAKAKINPLVLLMIFVVVSLSYWTVKAGLMMVAPMTFSVIFTYAYMGLINMGVNVSSVPIIAVGLGIGIDYSIYIMDRLREEMGKLNDIDAAIEKMLNTTGMAVSFTGTTLLGGIVLFIALSDLRFQHDSALLLTVMILANLFAALFVVPAWTKIFKPSFIVKAAEEEKVHVKAA